MALFLTSRRLVLALVLVVLLSSVTIIAQRKSNYRLNDLTDYLESLDIGNFQLTSDEKKPVGEEEVKITNNNDPEVLQKHYIENQVNELLKKKIAEELEYERSQLELERQKVKNEMKNTAKLANELKSKIKEVDAEADSPSAAPASGLVNVDIVTFESKEPLYIKKVYQFSSQETEGAKRFDPNNNELVILSSFHGTFGRDRNYGDFFKLIDGLDFPNPKASLVLLISDYSMFKEIDKFIAEVFKNIKESKSLDELNESFTKVTLMHTPFLEEKFKVDRLMRQHPKVQRQRRKTLAQMRNFLVVNGINNEKYSLFLDNDVIELPKDMMSIFIESKRDIATIRIDMKSPKGVSVHPDYDLNSWAGDRSKPTPEEEAKLDSDPEFYFHPKPGPNAIHFMDLSSNREKYGLSEERSAAYPLNSVGGAVLFAKSEVYQVGAMFPPYYSIGTNWDRLEGWDGIETEGLCYQAKSIGYQCWGFPNLIGYHTT